jgi:hypothetical protein
VSFRDKVGKNFGLLLDLISFLFFLRWCSNEAE